MMKKVTIIVVLFAFLANSALPSMGMAQALGGGLVLPQPGVMVGLTPVFTPAYLKGMVVDPNNPFKFDFIVFRGDKPLADAQKKEEYTRLIKYFLAALAVPDQDQWVNLSPYEKDRIIPSNFGLTEMGRDLLGQDYILKQLSSSLTYPDSALGKKFWSKVYALARERFGTTNVPASTFNKVWILPDKAVVYEKGNTAYVLENHLKVMIEQDYLASSKFEARGSKLEAGSKNKTINRTSSSTLGSQVMRDVIIPVIEKEVNEGANFARLRQVFSGMLLATWFKRELKASILGKLYINKGKVKGVDQDPRSNEEIYKEYLKAFKKGVFNMIKEDDTLGVQGSDNKKQGILPRKYFSGGTVNREDEAMIIEKNPSKADAAEMSKDRREVDVAYVDLLQSQKAIKSHNAAMLTEAQLIYLKEVYHLTEASLEVVQSNPNDILPAFYNNTSGFLTESNQASEKPTPLPYVRVLNLARDSTIFAKYQHVIVTTSVSNPDAVPFWAAWKKEPWGEEVSIRINEVLDWILQDDLLKRQDLWIAREFIDGVLDAENARQLFKKARAARGMSLLEDKVIQWALDSIWVSVAENVDAIKWNKNSRMIKWPYLIANTNLLILPIA